MLLRSEFAASRFTRVLQPLLRAKPRSIYRALQRYSLAAVEYTS